MAKAFRIIMPDAYTRLLKKCGDKSEIHCPADSPEYYLSTGEIQVEGVYTKHD
jgi:hypothetical protein